MLRYPRSYNAAWEQIKLHIGRVASSHASLARRVGSDLEAPLRSFSASSDFGQVSQFENNLSSLAEAHETTRQKSEKAKSKGKSKKQEEKAREENDARALWETESPLILEKIQTIDEARMILLKDIFVKCMMLEVETSQSSISEAEGIMNSLLSLTPSKEIESFVAQQKGTPVPATHERRRSIMSNTQTFTPSPSTPPASSRPPPPLQTRNTLSVPSEDSGSIRTEKRKSRFGTILRSGRNSMRSSNLHIHGFSPDKKRKEGDREQERAQTLATVSSQTSTNGVTEHPVAPARTSSMPNPELQLSPTRENPPVSRDLPTQVITEEEEQESILSSESTYAPPLRVEIKKDVIPEEAEERDAAVNTLQSTLRAHSTISRKTRGRRDGRSSYVGNDTNEFGLISPPTQEMGQLTISPIQETLPMTVYPTQEMAQMIIPSPQEPSQKTISPIFPSTNSRTLSPIRYTDSDAHSLSSVRTASRPSGIALHPDLETPGFNISILEFLSAIISDNKVQKIFVTGEIALSSHGQKAGGIQLANPGKIEQIVVNKALLNDAGNGTYSLTNENLPPKGAIAIKYKAALTEYPQAMVPLLLRTMWKVEPSSVSLMVGYQLNPLFVYSRTVSNVVLSATLPTELRITSCQSKPQGQFSRERGQLIWQIPTVGENEQVVIAKFSVEGQSKGPGTVEAKWECKGITISGIDVTGIGAQDPFAEEEDIFFQANVLRNLVSGKYYCQS